MSVPKNNLIPVKYIGRRSISNQSWEGGQRYCFSKANDFVCSIPTTMYEWIAQEFPGQYEVFVKKVEAKKVEVPKVEEVKEVIEEKKEVEEFICQCGFKANSKAGLKAHERFCKK